MYPLKNWTTLRHGYTFGQPTFYHTKHLGIDKLVPTGTAVYAPFKGQVRMGQGTQAGMRMELECTVSGQKYVIRFLHLSKFVKSGAVNEGDVIAYSGNTGTDSTAPHCHVDISKDKVDVNKFSNFVDPEKFNWLIKEDAKMLADLEDGSFNSLADAYFLKENYSYSGPSMKQEWLKAYGNLTIKDLLTTFKHHAYRKKLIGKLNDSFKSGKMSPKTEFYK